MDLLYMLEKFLKKIEKDKGLKSGRVISIYLYGV